MLHVSSLSKSYGKLLANDNIHFHLPENQVALLVGPNGAGKSTLLKCIVGLLRYAGKVTIAGHDNKSVEAKRLIGYVPEIPHLYPLLTVEEHLEFIARVYKLKDWEAEAEAWLSRFELIPHRKKLGVALSKGMQQKVSLCTALLPKPKLLLFDEPMIGLDPKAIKELKLVFEELTEAGHALLVSTHILDSVDEIWDQVLVMQGARLLSTAFRTDLDAQGKSLEDFFFSLTDGTPEMGPSFHTEVEGQAYRHESWEDPQA